MSGHTPGPWKAKFSFPGLNPGIGDTWQIDCDGHAVCTTQFCYAPDTEANARLIASAPDLLGALQRLVASVAWDADNAATEQALAAIARATGEAQ